MTSIEDFFGRYAAMSPDGPRRIGPDSAPWAQGQEDVLVPPSVQVSLTDEPSPYKGRGGRPPRIRSQITPRSRTDADFIARYIPWHFDSEQWGIYVWQNAFWGFARSLEEFASSQPRRPTRETVGEFAVRILIEHELVHFGAEVLATHLEALEGHDIYLKYLFDRYRIANPCASPVEEAIATAAEVRLGRSLGPEFASLTEAAGAYAKACGPGYADWELALDEPNLSAADAQHRRLMLDRAGLAGPLWRPSLDERHQVPIYWIPEFDPAGITLELPQGLTTKQGIPTLAVFRKWLRSVGLLEDPSRAKGDHVAIIKADGTKVGEYDSMGGRNSEPLYRGQAQSIARQLGFQRTQHLFEAIRTGAPLPAVPGEA